jgi:hypothetical protein
MKWGRRRFFAAIAQGVALATGIGTRAFTQPVASRSRVRTLLDEGWRFTRADSGAETDEPAAPDFNDGAWQQVTVPHDYAIAGPFTTAGGGGMGRLPTAGRVWYRNKITIPRSANGRSLFLEIDGAMSHSQVWLIGSTSISRAGGRTCRWRTFCRTGRGRNEWDR